MVRRVDALSGVLSLAIVPRLIFIDAEAKLPIHNADHTFGQFMMLLIVPLGVSIVVLGLWAMKARTQSVRKKAVS